MHPTDERPGEHVTKRHTPVARWLPVIVYGANMAGAMTTAVVVNATPLLYLAVLPLPALALYLWRTAKD